MAGPYLEAGRVAAAKATERAARDIRRAAELRGSAPRVEPVGFDRRQGLALVHFPARSEPFLTQHTHPMHPLIPPDTP